MAKKNGGKNPIREKEVLDSFRAFLLTYGHIARFAGSSLRGEELEESLYQAEAEGRLVLLDLLGRHPTDAEVARCLGLDKLNPKSP